MFSSRAAKKKPVLNLIIKHLKVTERSLNLIRIILQTNISLNTLNVMRRIDN